VLDAIRKKGSEGRGLDRGHWLLEIRGTDENRFELFDEFIACTALHGEVKPLQGREHQRYLRQFPEWLAWELLTKYNESGLKQRLKLRWTRLRGERLSWADLTDESWADFQVQE